MPSLWRRLRALPAADRRLLAEALLATLRARLDLRLIPFAALQRRMNETGASRRALPQTPERVAWAVAAVARRLPGTTCLAQSLAAHALLRRRGYRPELHIGVRVARPEAGAGGANAVPDSGSGSVRRGVRWRERAAAVPLDAHAWVECEGRVVAGDLDDLAEYGRLQSVRPPVSAAPGSP